MDKKLPLFQYRDTIIETVCKNQVVIITAETGSGKSTQVPQYLLNHGYKALITQPRRLAAVSLATYVAQSIGIELGATVGYHTAFERAYSAKTDLLYCTDGLALVRKLMGEKIYNVLIIDEIHEWNMNIEALIAWSRLRLGLDEKCKLILMSATLEKDDLSAYFGGIPIIDIPHRLYSVTDIPAGPSVVEDAAWLLEKNFNVLVFQPGKKEIEKCGEELAARNLHAEILPLHSLLATNDQAKCFQAFSRPKCVIATNIAQTSITIPDIDAVVDSGYERRQEVVGGVEGLYLRPISWADVKQRKGRAGRTKPGMYIDHCQETDRPMNIPPEILRVRLDQIVLRLAEANIDAEEIKFFHQPDVREIQEAKRALTTLGCLDDAGAVTEIGHQVAKMPLSAKFGRMIIEAENLGVVDDIITIAAIHEVGHIVKSDGVWRSIVQIEKDSDSLALLALYKAFHGRSQSELESAGIYPKNFFRIVEIRQHLYETLQGMFSFYSSGNRENILRSICAGMIDHLYRRSSSNIYYADSSGQERIIDRISVVSDAEWIVGLPWDLEIQAQEGKKIIRQIRMASKVNPFWLAELAPHLVRIETGYRPRSNAQEGAAVPATLTYFNNFLIEEKKVPNSSSLGTVTKKQP